jgi:hypothetical protein
MTARGKAYTPAEVESSRVESHESCRVGILDAASFIFVSRTLGIGREGCYCAVGSECGVLYCCAVQSVLKTYCIRADLIGLDSVDVHPSRLLESDWTRLRWWVITIRTMLFPGFF